MLKKIDQITDGFLNRYSNDVLATEGVVYRALESPMAGSALEDAQMVQKVIRTIESFSYSEMFSYTNNAVEELLADVFGEKAIPEVLLRAVKGTMADAVLKIDGQKRSDVRALIKHYRMVIVRADHLVRANGWSRKASILAVKQKNKVPVTFYSVDRSGKQWDSKKYVRTVLRHALLTIYNESKIFRMTLQGKKVAYVQNSDINHPAHGTEFRIAPDGQGNSYDDIKDIVFHPNSNAVVADNK